MLKNNHQPPLLQITYTRILGKRCYGVKPYRVIRYWDLTLEKEAIWYLFFYFWPLLKWATTAITNTGSSLKSKLYIKYIAWLKTQTMFLKRSLNWLNTVQKIKKTDLRTLHKERSTKFAKQVYKSIFLWSDEAGLL